MDQSQSEPAELTTKNESEESPTFEAEAPETLLDEPQQIEVNDASRPYEGQWNQLVSTTNWEKGRIIHQWREALTQTDAPATTYSDESWALRVGGITGQHVGRLRRVYRRFGQQYEQFEGLYWSHFQAAMDWDDAEMWLEGAIQSSWSVSQMRRMRWDTLGAPPELKPKDEDIVHAELDEDFEPAKDRKPGSDEESRPRAEGPDFGDESEASIGPDSSAGSDGSAILAGDDPGETIEFVRPFENLGDLPEDLTEAFESFKLSILRHKGSDWEEISRDDVLASLDALKQLVLAPSADPS